MREKQLGMSAVQESVSASHLRGRAASRRTAGFRRADGEYLLMDRYFAVNGRECDLANPTRFTEKLTRRMIKLHRRPNPHVERLVDKLAARQEVAAMIGEEHLTRLLWHGKDPADIPFASLPDRYVVKTNHASGHVLVVREKIDAEQLRRKISNRLSINYYWEHREAQYDRIPARALIEELLEEPDASPPIDYRLWCFHGVARMITATQLLNGRVIRGAWYDAQWNKLDFGFIRRQPLPHSDFAAPAQLERMVEIAGTLSRSWDFVRVDLYNIAGRILFGEMTFTPGAGGMRFDPDLWDDRLGSWWRTRRPAPLEESADRRLMKKATEGRTDRLRTGGEPQHQLRRDLLAKTTESDFVILIDDGVLGPEPLPNRRTTPMTARDGTYWGPPADDDAALQEFTRLVEEGANVVAFAWHSFWWLDHYRSFVAHLEREWTKALDTASVVAYTKPPTGLIDESGAP